jgi:hypothetical protein
MKKINTENILLLCENSLTRYGDVEYEKLILLPTLITTFAASATDL